MAEKKPETLEETMDQLNGILDRMEREELSLEESIAWYQKGLELIRSANSQIDTIEKQCILVDEEGDMHEF